MNASPRFSMIARWLCGSRGSTLAEALVASAIGAFILVGVMTTYIISIKSFTAFANYREIHAGGRRAVNYFAKDMRGVSSIKLFPNSSNITVYVPMAFDSSGGVTSNKIVSYSMSRGGLYRYDSSTGNTDLLASNISQLTFTLFDLIGNSNSVTLVNAKGVQLDIKLRKTVMSQIQSEDYLSARYDMRNTAN